MRSNRSSNNKNPSPGSTPSGIFSIFLHKTAVLLLFIHIQAGFSTVIQQDMILNILVKGDEFLTQQVKVQKDETIDYPLFQDTPVVGLTTRELQDILTVKLANYTDAPFVLVTIIEEMPINVIVLGQVRKPGPLKVPPQSSLQEIILAAGGTTEFGNLEKVKILHKGQIDEQASFYNLKEFMVTGNFSLLPKILDHDKIIVLSERKNTKIKVLGAVNKPGYYAPHDSSNVFDIIYMAGGPLADANLTKVRILSQVDNKETDSNINLQKYIDDGKLSEVPLILPGDVIIVYRKSFTWGKTLAVVRDVTVLITAMILILNFNKLITS